MDLETVCAEHGLKLTHQRRAVWRALQQHGDPWDVEQILRHAQRIDPKISRVTVYRTVNALRQAGVLSQQRAHDRRARYAVRDTNDCR